MAICQRGREVQGWEMTEEADGQMLHRCVRSPFQLLLNRMEGLAVEVDLAEWGAPGCAVVSGRLLIMSTTALALSVL